MSQLHSVVLTCVYINIVIFIYLSHSNCVGIIIMAWGALLNLRVLWDLALLMGPCGFIHLVSASRDLLSSQSMSAALTSVSAALTGVINAEAVSMQKNVQVEHITCCREWGRKPQHSYTNILLYIC